MKMSRLNEIFPNKVCINLQRRPDRKQQSIETFNRFKIDNVKFIDATDYKETTLNTHGRKLIKNYRAEMCCSISHLRAILFAKQNGWDKVLIFEDDVCLAPDFNELFDKYIDYVPENWDMIYFGGMNRQPLIEINEFVSRIVETYRLEAYAIHSNMYDKVIRFCIDKTTEILKSTPQKEWDAYDFKNCLALDLLLKDLQLFTNCYIFNNQLSGQIENFSDIQHFVK